MPSLQRRTVFAVGALALSLLFAAPGWAVDVFVVYSGRDGGQRNQVVNSLPRNLDVKTYNVDLLALADYSGKQKALGKISRAEVVIIVGSRPMDILKKTTVKSNLIIFGNTSTSIKASESRIHVVGANVNTSGLGRTVEIKTAADLDDTNALKGASVLLVNESEVSLTSVVATLTALLAG